MSAKILLVASFVFFFLRVSNVNASCNIQEILGYQNLVATHQGIPFQHDVVLSIAHKVMDIGIDCFANGNPHENSQEKVASLVLIHQFYARFSPEFVDQTHYWKTFRDQFYRWTQDPNDFYSKLVTEIWSYLQSNRRFWKDISFEEKRTLAEMHFEEFLNELQAQKLRAGQNSQEVFDQIYEQSLSRQRVLHLTTQTLENDLHFNTILMAVQPVLRHPLRIKYLTQLLSMLPDQVPTSIQHQLDSYKYLAAVDLYLEYRWQYDKERNEANWDRQLAMERQVVFWESSIQISEEDPSGMSKRLRDKQIELSQDLRNLTLVPFIKDPEMGGQFSHPPSALNSSSEIVEDLKQPVPHKLVVFPEEGRRANTPQSSPSISQPGAPRPDSGLDERKFDDEETTSGDEASTSQSVSRTLGASDSVHSVIPAVPEGSDEGSPQKEKRPSEEKRDSPSSSESVKSDSATSPSLPAAELRIAKPEVGENSSSGPPPLAWKTRRILFGKTFEGSADNRSSGDSEKKVSEVSQISSSIKPPNKKRPSRRNQRQRKGKPPVSSRRFSAESSALLLNHLSWTESASNSQNPPIEKESDRDDLESFQKSPDLSLTHQLSLAGPKQDQASEERKSSEAPLGRVGSETSLELEPSQEWTDRQGSNEDAKQGRSSGSETEVPVQSGVKAIQSKQKPKKIKKKKTEKNQSQQGAPTPSDDIDWDQFREEPTKFTSSEKMGQILGALANPMTRSAGIQQAEEWVRFLDSKSLVLKIDRENKVKILFHLAKARTDRTKQLEILEKASKMVENEDFGEWGIECLLEYYRILTLEKVRYGKKSQAEVRYQSLYAALEKSSAEEVTRARWLHDLSGILSRNGDQMRSQEVYALASKSEDLIEGHSLIKQSSLPFSERVNQFLDPQSALDLTVLQRYRNIAQFLMENLPERISEPEVRIQLQALASKLLEGSEERDFSRFHQLYFKLVGRTTLLRLQFTTANWKTAYQSSSELRQFVMRDLKNELSPLDTRVYESSMNLFWETMIQTKMRLGDEQGARELHAEVSRLRFRALNPFVASVSSGSQISISSPSLERTRTPMSEQEVLRLFKESLVSNDLTLLEYQASIDQMLDRVVYEPGKLYWQMLRGQLMEKLFDHAEKVGNVKNEHDFGVNLTSILKIQRLSGELIFGLLEKSQDAVVMNLALKYMQNADLDLLKRKVITEGEYDKRTLWILQECKKRKISTTAFQIL